jgi:hypothetical protein
MPQVAPPDMAVSRSLAKKVSYMLVFHLWTLNKYLDKYELVF